jgi:hypothetical protein
MAVRLTRKLCASDSRNTESFLALPNINTNKLSELGRKYDLTLRTQAINVVSATRTTLICFLTPRGLLTS